jgi:hypothetical protein
MADLAAQSSHQLFKQWRGGDAEAGKAMAQRFSDWYYAITTARLGDENGRGPLERSCVTFQQGIVNVTKASHLVEWAHDIVAKEVDAAGRRNTGGDFPNALTKNESPTSLIRTAAAKLDAAQIELLQKAYSVSANPDSIANLAMKSGGYPSAVYKVRLALRQALQSEAGIVFSTSPSADNLDWAPVPLYEAGKLASPSEERAFERWMLQDPAVCREIAEFAAFAHALRAGALQGARPTAARPQRSLTPGAAPTPAARAANHPAAAPSSGFTSSQVAAIGGLAFVAVLVAVMLGIYLLRG